MKTKVIALSSSVFLAAAGLCMALPAAIYAEETTEEAVATDYLEEDPEEIEETYEADETYEGETFSDILTEDIAEISEGETVLQAREATGETYTVTFHSDGGSAVASQNVAAGEKAAKPDDPTYAGYRFLGWFVEPTLQNIINEETRDYNTFDFSKPITDNLELTALWYSVLTVNTTGAGVGYIDVVKMGDEPEFDGKYTQSAQQIAIKGLYEDFTIAANAAENTAFLRWIDTDTGETISTDKRIDLKVTGDRNLEAEFDSIFVMFDSNGGSPVEPQNVAPGATIKKPEDPTNGDLTFIGWFKDPTLENLIDNETYEYNTFDFSTPVTESMDLTALWGAVFTVEISGDPISGQIAVAGPNEKPEFRVDRPMQSAYTNVILGLYDTFQVGAKASDGYRFVKWVDTDTGKTYATDEVINVEITQNLNLAAVFEEDVQKSTPTPVPTETPTVAPTATPAPTGAATAVIAPKTGDDTPVMTWLGILLMVALGLGTALKIKIRNGKEVSIY